MGFLSAMEKEEIAIMLKQIMIYIGIYFILTEIIERRVLNQITLTKTPLQQN